MRLTDTHRRFVLQRAGRWPSWASMPKPKTYFVGNTQAIDFCINDHAGIKFEHSDASNLMYLLRLMRKRGEMVDGLRRMAVTPGTVINPKRRAAFCKKWLARISRSVYGV